MQRVFDFTPAEHEIVVSRILLQVHRAVDETFPNARPASQRFSKTAFVGSDEPTLTQQIPSETLKDALAGAEAGSESYEGRGVSRSRQKEGIDERAPFKAPDRASIWRFTDNMPLKQTLIGILSLVLVALLAYLMLTL